MNCHAVSGSIDSMTVPVMRNINMVAISSMSVPGMVKFILASMS